MTFRGFWPILPFAGLEMFLLGWALRRQPRTPPPQRKPSPSRTTDVRIEQRDIALITSKSCFRGIGHAF